METAKRTVSYPKLEYLEALRFVLAFLAMAWHYYYFGPRYGLIRETAIHARVFRYLSFTVEVFFIISGFIIIASSINRKPLDFLVGRAARLGPCLLLCASVTVAVRMLSGSHVPLADYVSSILIFPLTWDGGVDPSYWSLRFELLFYALIFVSLCVFNIEKHIYGIAVALIAYDATVIVIRLLGIAPALYHDLQQPVGRYAPFFAIGILLYLVFVRKEMSVRIGAALLAACATGWLRTFQESNRVAYMASDSHVSLLTSLLVFAAVTGVFALFVRTTGNRRLARVFGVLGKTSYPLYLIHQEVGYRVIGFLQPKLPAAVDVRPLLMIAMVVAAAVIANYAEPFLAARYKKHLGSLFAAGRSFQMRASGAKTPFGD